MIGARRRPPTDPTGSTPAPSQTPHDDVAPTRSRDRPRAPGEGSYVESVSEGRVLYDSHFLTGGTRVFSRENPFVLSPDSRYTTPPFPKPTTERPSRSEEHTSELQ